MGAQHSTSEWNRCRCINVSQQRGWDDEDEPIRDEDDGFLLLNAPLLTPPRRITTPGKTSITGRTTITSANVDGAAGISMDPNAVAEPSSLTQRVSKRFSIQLPEIFGSPHDVALTVASLSDLQQEAGNAEEGSESDVISEAAMSVSQSVSLCTRRSLLVSDMLPYLAIDNPDNINNVYTFSKDKIVQAGNTDIVRKATVKVTGAVRAIRLIPKSMEPGRMASIKARVDVTMTFDHPNIIRLHEIFEDDSYVYLVMSYCSGGSLHDLLKDGTLSEVKASFIMQQIFYGVNYLHTHRVCHRDLRPRNILFNSKVKDVSSTSLIKLSGLGSACKIRRKKPMEQAVGRPGFMAPEMSSDSYGKEVDLWSCGVVMFKILCGRLPFPHQPSADKEIEINFQPEDNLSDSARDLIGLLLECNPRARYNVQQALQHKWLEKGAPKSAMPFNASTLAHLKTFRKLSVFQQAVLRIVASHLSDHETANCRKLFAFLDKNGDGNLVPSELETIISMDPQIKSAYPDIAAIFGQADGDDHHGCRKLAFTYTEFVAATFDRQKCLTEAVLRVAFRCFDKNGDGTMSISELAGGHLLGDLSTEQVGKTFEAMDKNHDSQIDFKEFMAMVRQSLCA